MEAEQNSGLTLTVIKAMDILDYLGGQKEAQSASEIGRALGMSRTTAYRLLTTLATGGYVMQDVASPDRYGLGFKIVELASSLLDRIELRQQARPILRDLRDAANETVHLVVLEQGQVAYVDKLECLQAVRMHSTIGRQGYVHSTSVGKAMLAFMPRAQVNQMLDKHGMPALTSRTITDRDALFRELARVRSLGYAIDDIENEDGIRCVGAPIFDHQGNPVAALSLSGPSFRMTPERAKQLGSSVRRAGLAISRLLGYQE